MATITTASSGLSTATGTWTGGVVPGTTFAGTRTTSASASIGATTLALTAASPAVTAGKWLKIGTNQYRVATGLGTGAGNVILDSPGLVAAVASGASVSVDMVDDKVSIAHPGTHTTNTTVPYLLNGAHSAGATSIAVNTGSGTILAGECIQFEHAIGTDEDGETIHDPTYYQVATSLTAGVIIISAGLTYAMASGVVVRNRGHVVELAGDHVWGDDTSSLTAGSNGINVSGTLKASRTTSTTLVARGTIFANSTGLIDFGRPTSDPIPSSKTFTCVLNDSATLASGKHGMASGTAQNGVGFFLAGSVRTRNTRLTSGISAGATSITVDASTGWAVGDRLVIASDTDNPNRAQVVTITAGSSPTWTVGAITNARSAACRVGNLSSNVELKGYAASTPGFFGVGLGSNGATSFFKAQDIRCSELGTTSAWATVSAGSVTYAAAIGFLGGDSLPAMIRRVASETTTTTGTGTIACGLASINAHKVSDCAVHSLGTVSCGIQMHAGAAWSIDAVVYRHGLNALTSNNSDGSADCVISGEFWGGSPAFNMAPSVKTTFNGASLHAASQALSVGNGTATFNNTTFGGTAILTNIVVGGSYNLILNNPTFTGTTLSASLTTGNRPKQTAAIRVIANGGVAADNRVLNYYQTTVTDTSTRKRSTYSVKIQPLVANTAITYLFTIPAASGVAQTIKGSLRFDSTYGTATPPSIALSGQGVTQSYTCTATADTWFDFTFTFTPTGTGDITATVRVQSASTSGFAWLDGVYHYPMTQSVRHFGYLWKPQAAQEVDTTITVSEATALAYPVVVSHGSANSGVIFVTGDATARQIYEACMADLCQTTKLSETVHISTVDGGETFTTTYIVIPQSGVTITGNYTDPLGVHVAATAVLPIAGCRVQLYNETSDEELANYVVSGTTFTYPLVYDTYSAGNLLRLRVAYQSGTTAKLPQEEFASLTSVGASFTVPDQDDTVYASNGINGATTDVSGGGEFAADYPNLQIDVSDGDGTTSVQRVYAWSVWANAQANGIRLMFKAVEAQDELNYLIDTSVVSARFDNTAATPVVITGGYIRRSDGTTVIASTSGSIQMDPGRAYIAAGTVPTAAQNATAVRTELTTELDRLDVAVSTRLATSGYTAPDNATIVSTGAAVAALPTAAQNADKLLGRSLATGADGGRTVKDALRASRNKTEISGSTLTVYAEDDTTPAWTAAVTTAERDALSGIDPA